MKHYLKIVIVAGIFASVCYWNSINTTEQVKSLVLQNVEALADDEFSSGPTACFGSGSLNCPFESSKVKYIIQGHSLEE